MAASFREILSRTSDARFEELMAIIEIHNGYSAGSRRFRVAPPRSA
jgi:hypothetical protein